MRTAEVIRQIGFRRWYDRALIRGHGHLVTGFLGLILALSGIELLGAHAGLATALSGAGLTGAGIVLVSVGLRHYHDIMVLAERLAARATCPACAAYASFDVVACDSQPERQLEDKAAIWMRVRCRRCREEWTL